MNELLLFDVGNQKHAETVRCAERNALKSTASAIRGSLMRDRMATVLVLVASRLQPGLRCELLDPIQPATA